MGYPGCKLAKKHPNKKGRVRSSKNHQNHTVGLALFQQISTTLAETRGPALPVPVPRLPWVDSFGRDPPRCCPLRSAVLGGLGPCGYGYGKKSWDIFVAALNGEMYMFAVYLCMCFYVNMIQLSQHMLIKHSKTIRSNPRLHHK